MFASVQASLSGRAKLLKSPGDLSWRRRIVEAIMAGATPPLRKFVTRLQKLQG
jgi:hypothetical protein